MTGKFKAINLHGGMRSTELPVIHRPSEVFAHLEHALLTLNAVASRDISHYCSPSRSY
jgi:hypothetical protein